LAASLRRIATETSLPSHPHTSTQRPRSTAPIARAFAPLPASANDIRVSASSESRAMSGAISACASPRSASQPASKSRNAKPS
jgi:hypothetical protein